MGSWKELEEVERGGQGKEGSEPAARNHSHFRASHDRERFAANRSSFQVLPRLVWLENAQNITLQRTVQRKNTILTRLQHSAYSVPKTGGFIPAGLQLR